MQKILVAGSIGAGKTTLAQDLAVALDLPFAEIDALYHGPNWTKRPQFESDLDQFTSQNSWVTEWLYPQVRPLLAQRADTLIWLDLPLPVVLYRVTTRTLRRWWRLETVWAGNREPAPWKILWDKSNMIRWSWASRHQVPQEIPKLRAQYPDLQIVRLRSRRDAQLFLADPRGQAPKFTWPATSG